MAMKFPGMKEQEQNEPTPDVGVLPKSGGKSLDKSGIKDTGYLEKKEFKLVLAYAKGKAYKTASLREYFKKAGVQVD